MPESIRDLNLNRAGFEEEIMKLPVDEFAKVLKRDDLTCHSEDQVLNLTLNYIDLARERILNEIRTMLMPLIKLDQLSKASLIDLSKRSDLIKGMEHLVI